MMTLKEFVNWKLTHSDKVTSAEGYPLLMENCKTNKKMKQLEVYGNSIQNDTPSIENPIEVESVGEPTENLFRDTEIPSTHTTKGLTIDYEGNGIYHLYGVYDGATGRTELTVNQPFDKNKRYVGYVKLLSGVLPGRITSYFGIGSATVERVNWLSIHAISGMQVGDINTTVAYSEYTISKLEDATHISKFWFYMAPATLPTNSEIDVRIQIWVKEYGTSNEYEPYGKYKIPVVVKESDTEVVTQTVFINEPLRKLGDYADYIDFKEKKVVRRCAKRYLKDYNWGNGTTEQFDTHTAFKIKDNSILPTVSIDSAEISKGYSNHFPMFDSYDSYKKTPLGIHMHAWSMNVVVTMPKEIIPNGTMIKFIVWLNANNPYMIRVLAEPTEESIECDLPKLTNKTSVIEIDTTIAPSDIKGKYIKK